MAKKTTAKQARKHIRFTPDPGTLAYIDLADAGRAFQASLPALVVEESYRGCGLVLAMTEQLQVGDSLRVAVGKSAPLKAEVRWRTELDSQVIRVGLMYLA